jgi:hypothetical protein
VAAGGASAVGRVHRRGGGVPVEGRVRTRMIELFPDVVERSRLGAKSCARRSGGCGCQHARPALMAAILWRCARCHERRPEAQAPGAAASRMR